MSEAVEATNFEGLPGTTCDHRTVGPHRAWCHDCREWCYPSDPCLRCTATAPVDWPARFRAAEKEARAKGLHGTADRLEDLASILSARDPDVVGAIGRALMGEETRT